MRTFKDDIELPLTVREAAALLDGITRTGPVGTITDAQLLRLRYSENGTVAHKWREIAELTGLHITGLMARWGRIKERIRNAQGG